MRKKKFVIGVVIATLIILGIIISRFILNKEYVQFKKYSYYLPQLKYGTYYGGYGTGFFFKNNNDTFLVSNYHIFSGFSPFNPAKRENEPDELYLRLLNDDDNSFISESLLGLQKELSTPIDIRYDIDVYKMKIKDIPAYYNVNFINSYIDSTYFDKIPESVFFYGFEGDLTERDLSSASLIKGKYTSYSQWYNDVYHSASASPEFGERYFFTANSEQGISGSPVFGKFVQESDGKKIDVYKFIGIAFGIELNAHKTWVLKAKYVYKYLLNQSTSPKGVPH